MKELKIIVESGLVGDPPKMLHSVCGDEAFCEAIPIETRVEIYRLVAAALQKEQHENHA